MPRDFQRPFQLPAGATEVLLIRHGSARYATPEAPLDLVDGHSDPALTELGLRQAEALSERLGALRTGGLFVSPLQRTQQTAAPLARRLGLTPVVLSDLREVHLGE